MFQLELAHMGLRRYSGSVRFPDTQVSAYIRIGVLRRIKSARQMTNLTARTRARPICLFGCIYCSIAKQYSCTSNKGAV